MEKLSQDLLDKIARGEATTGDDDIFGLPKEGIKNLMLIPVPWEATASYGRGTATAPYGIIEASAQVDLEDLCFDRPYQFGIGLDEINEDILALNERAVSLVQEFRDKRDAGNEDLSLVAQVNRMSDQVNSWLAERSLYWRKQNKLVGILGGDHSVPFAFIKQLATEYEKFGILHIDAHFDLRNQFEGFHFSHASIMHNVITQIPQVSSLVQIGIRDFSREERLFAEDHKDRLHTFYDRQLFRSKAEGETFKVLTHDILSLLPKHVYISFDIDGLKREFCPQTGTPVPGGLEFNEAVYLIEELALSGRKIIGFDLVEVAGDRDKPWDYNVGARMLYKLCAAMVHSQNL